MNEILTIGRMLCPAVVNNDYLHNLDFSKINKFLKARTTRINIKIILAQKKYRILKTAYLLTIRLMFQLLKCPKTIAID